MKANIKWLKENINGKWFSVADVQHVPMIEHCKDGSYKVRNCLSSCSGIYNSILIGD